MESPSRLIQEGPRQTRLVIVGEAPGRQEDVEGRPFVGGSGVILNLMLERSGIRRSEAFITNVCHVKPPKNDFAWFIKPTPRPELIQGLLQLKADLEEIKPNLVLAMGAQPLRFLTGKQEITKWRGSILPCSLVPGLKVMGTYHPAYIMRQWDYKAVAEFDLQRAAKQMEFPEIRRPQRNLILNPSYEESINLKRELLQARWLAVDIECVDTPHGWQLSCVGFSDDASRAVVWPCDEPWKMTIIHELCESHVPKVFQNGKFDVSVLATNHIKVPIESYQWDTMYGHHSLFTESASGSDEISSLGGKKKQAALQKGLAFQTSIYTDEPYYKDDGKLWKETNDKQMFWRYNALDAAVTREIRDVQERELSDFGTMTIFRHEMRLVEPLMLMEHRGILIDMEQRQRTKTKLEEEISRLQTYLDKAVGHSVNVKSPKQIVQLLYEDLKLPKKRNHKTGNLTADKDAITALAERHSNPVLTTVLKIRQRRDFIERYLNAQIDPDGRIRCAFDQAGTRSGRLASRQSLSGSGTNLQNIPSRRPEGEEVRRMFLADPGKVIIGRDYSQAEARIVAYLASAYELIELFNDPSRDVHTENASRIFNKPLDQITPEERYLAKRVIHAANYGMEVDRLVTVVNEDAPYTGVRIDRARAKQLLAAYFMLYPEIRETFWKNIERQLRDTRTLNTPYNRKRLFFGRWDDKLLREAYSYIPQSTVGDLGTDAIIRCYEQIEKTVDGAQLWLQVHDAVYMQCWEKDAGLVAEMMRQSMNIPITMNGVEFYIPTDCKIGYNWGKMIPDENPRGMVSSEKWLAHG